MCLPCLCMHVGVQGIAGGGIRDRRTHQLASRSRQMLIGKAARRRPRRGGSVGCRCVLQRARSPAGLPPRGRPRQWQNFLCVN